jgi:hypothetical protein
MFLVFAVPFKALLERGFGRHFVLMVPEFVHGIWQQDTPGTAPQRLKPRFIGI